VAHATVRQGNEGPGRIASPIMSWSRPPSPGLHPSHLELPGHRDLDLVTNVLDPVLVPLGFAHGQIGAVGERGQVIFCRGEIDTTDSGCVDLVVEIEATPDWQITDVRYWGFPSDRWHLDFDRGVPLADQLAGLSQTLPTELE
jgi:hypothetical protein